MIAFFAFVSFALAQTPQKQIATSFPNCIEATKTFTITDDNSKFKKISIIKNSTIKIESESPNEPLTFDCSFLYKADVIAQNWKISENSIIPLEFNGKEAEETSYTLTNKNEKVIQEKIIVNPNGDIELKDANWLDENTSIHLSCGADHQLSAKSISLSILKHGKLIHLYQSLKLPETKAEEKAELATEPSFQKNNCPKEDYELNTELAQLKKNPDSSPPARLQPSSSTGQGVH